MAAFQSVLTTGLQHYLVLVIDNIVNTRHGNSTALLETLKFQIKECLNSVHVRYIYCQHLYLGAAA